MNVGIILICLLFLALWWFDKTLDKRKLVLACTHENLEVRALPKSLGGTLFLHCKCGYQAHLRELRPLRDGTFWLMSGKTWDEAQDGFLKAYHEHPPKSKPLP